MDENPYQSPLSKPAGETELGRTRVGLLSKTNPQATPQSVARHAAIMGVIGLVSWAIADVFKGPFPAWSSVPWCAALSCLGALMEWQCGDDLDDLEIGDNDNAS